MERAFAALTMERAFAALLGPQRAAVVFHQRPFPP